jgi:hypothetical protein
LKGYWNNYAPAIIMQHHQERWYNTMSLGVVIKLVKVAQMFDIDGLIFFGCELNVFASAVCELINTTFNLTGYMCH